VVDAIRRQFRIKKVGHCGTLDPAATGLLIIVLGRGTKLSERLMADDKVYEGTMKLGESTTSHDADGDLTGSLPVPPLSLDELNELGRDFVGDQMQLPPMVSAIKKDGVPLYKLARKGVEVERKERLIHIYSFRFSAYEEPWPLSASPARRAPTFGPSRMISEKNSDVAHIWPHCAGLCRVGSMWLMRFPWRASSHYRPPSSSSASFRC
jgi:tRNA pseudouridine(55) synthase